MQFGKTKVLKVSSSVNSREIKLSQYVDDTTLILDGTKESLIASLKTLDDFYEVSSLNLNDKKNRSPFHWNKKWER